MVAEKKSEDLKWFYLVLGATAVLAIGVLGWPLLSGRSSTATEPIAGILSGDLEDVEALIGLATGIERGDPDAPITILEFADFQCLSCQYFATVVKPQIDLAYVDEGVARFAFHDWPLVNLHAHAFFASRAARCALDQGDQYFWPFHDQLFAHQSTWSLSQTAPVNAFESYAAVVGLDVDDFASCLAGDRHADVISANMRLGQQLGVDRTPTLFVSTGRGMATRVERWSEFEAFEEVIERLLEEDVRDGA